MHLPVFNYYQKRASCKSMKIDYNKAKKMFYKEGKEFWYKEILSP